MPSSEEEDDEEKALEDEIRVWQKRKNEMVECARSFSEELAKMAQSEEDCRDRLRRLRAKKRGKEKQQQADQSLTVVEVHASVQARSEIVDSSNVTESELNHVKCENVELKQSLDQAAKQSKTQLEKIAELECSITATQLELRETRQRLSDVQERLTVAEQVTAATQQRALQESGNSEQLQLELTPQHQPTTHSGLRVSFTSVWLYVSVTLSRTQFCCYSKVK